MEAESVDLRIRVRYPKVGSATERTEVYREKDLELSTTEFRGKAFLRTESLWMILILGRVTLHRNGYCNLWKLPYIQASSRAESSITLYVRDLPWDIEYRGLSSDPSEFVSAPQTPCLQQRLFSNPDFRVTYKVIELFARLDACM
jgi:hypothetical protein